MAAAVVIIALGALVWVVTPLRSGPRTTAAERDQLVEEAEERKRAALVAIVDIDLENQVGKLSTEDHRVLRTQYEIEAIKAMRELDELGIASANNDDPIEAEIAAMREALTCPSCGAVRPRSKPCPACGHS